MSDQADTGQAPRQARYIVRKADHVGGASIPDDEPCLVIRAQDRLALVMMDLYIQTYINSGMSNQEVLDDLYSHQADIVRWQREHEPKWADR